MSNTKQILISFCVFAILACLWLPLSLKVNFMQNDDFFYYSTVANFTQGQFNLPAKMAPTFYIQGMLGMIYANVFGLTNLPILTLLVSSLNIGLLVYLLLRFFRLDPKYAIIFGLFLFFNPLYQYSIMGFMTENYIILFLLLALITYYHQQETTKVLPEIMLYLWIVLGTLTRQVFLVVPLAFALTHLGKREYRTGIKYLMLFSSLFAFYIFVFPQTAEMHEKTLQLHHLLEFKYVFSLLYGIVLYLSAFFAPMVGLLIIQKLSWKKLAVITVLTATLFLTLNKIYTPMEISWGEFPFFENTFERTGFLPRDILGSKYHFRGNFDLYRHWELAAKVLTAGALAVIILVKRGTAKTNELLWLCITYMGLMIVTQTFYDRYLVFLLVPVLLALIRVLNTKSTATIAVALPFLLFLGYFSYFLTSDFIGVNSRVWQKSENLTKDGVPADKIYASRAWNQSRGSGKDTATYIFSYDKDLELPNVKRVDKFRIDFPLNPYVEPYIYLFEQL